MASRSALQIRTLGERSFVSETTKILSGLKSRDPAILKAFFNELNPYMLRMLASHKIFSDQAEDLVHQTWETFFKNLEKFESRSQLKTFLIGILMNKIREHRRANQRLVFEESSEDFLNHHFTPDGWWKKDPEDPYQYLESTELGEFLKECIEGLTETQRSAFVMVEVEEESSQEICNILQVSHSNLRVLLFRAKEKLRSCLQGKLST